MLPSFLIYKENLPCNFKEKIILDTSAFAKALTGDVEEVNKLLSKGADISYTVRGYAMGNHPHEVADLLSRRADINEAIIGYAHNGKIDEVNHLIAKADDKVKARDAAILGYAWNNREEGISQINLLLCQGADVNEAAKGFIHAFNKKLVNYCISKGANINKIVFQWAVFGKVTYVNKLLDKYADIADINEAILGYSSGYPANLYGKDQVNLLLEKSPNKTKAKNAAVRGYASSANKEEVDDLIRQGASKKIAIQGYVEGGYFEEAKTLYYEIQKSKRNIRTTLVVLGAIFLTPLSLIVSIPLWILAKNNESIQKLVTSQDKYEDIKEKRKFLRVALTGNDHKIKDYDKPKKTFLSKEGTKTVYLVDKAQLARFKLFTKHDKNDIYVNKDEIKKQVTASKAESKTIIRNLGW